MLKALWPILANIKSNPSDIEQVIGLEVVNALGGLYLVCFLVKSCITSCFSYVVFTIFMTHFHSHNPSYQNQSSAVLAWLSVQSRGHSHEEMLKLTLSGIISGHF